MAQGEGAKREEKTTYKGLLKLDAGLVVRMEEGGVVAYSLREYDGQSLEITIKRKSEVVGTELPKAVAGDV